MLTDKQFNDFIFSHLFRIITHTITLIALCVASLWLRVFSVFLYDQMDIPIHVQGGASTLVRFEGCGLNSPTQGSINRFNCSDTKASEPTMQRLPFPGQVRAVLVFSNHIFISIYSAEYQQSAPYKSSCLCVYAYLRLYVFISMCVCRWYCCPRTVSRLVTSLCAHNLQESSSWPMCPTQTLSIIHGTYSSRTFSRYRNVYMQLWIT